jgi:D-alanine-D-alanine ligase
MARLAVSACQALRVDSMARVDFFYEQGGRGLLVNEVNTIPGFTPISMYPRLWQASGISYPQLVDELVAQARRRAGRRARFITHRL